MAVHIQTPTRRLPPIRLTLSLFGLTAAAAAPPDRPRLPEDGGGAVRLRSPDLPGVEGLVAAAAAQRAALTADLSAVLVERRLAWRILRRREQVPLRLLPGPWRARARRAFAETEAEALEVRAMIARSRVRVAFAADPPTLAAQQALWESFVVLSRAERIQEAMNTTEFDGERERPGAAAGGERIPMSLALGRDELVAGDLPPLCVRTATGARLDLHPGFAVLRERGTAARRLLDLRDVGIDVEAVDVLEEKAVPADARIVGHAWIHANRDGSPDRRFKDNREIPRIRYGAVRITTPFGPLADLWSSDGDAAFAFVSAFRQLHTALAGMAREPPSDEPVAPIVPIPLESVPPLPPLPRIGRAHDATAVAAAVLVLATGLFAAAANIRRHALPREAAVDPVPVVGASTVAPSMPQQPAAPPPVVDDLASRLATGSIAIPAVRPGAARTGIERAHSVRRPAIPAAAAVADHRDAQVTARRPTRLRVCPSRDSPGLGTLARGTRLDVFGHQGSWVEVGQAKPWGWVSARSLAKAT